MTDIPTSTTDATRRANFYPTALLLTDDELIAWADATAATLRPMSSANALDSEIWETLSDRYRIFELAAAEHAKGRKKMADLIKDTLERSGAQAYENRWLSFKTVKSTRTTWKALVIDNPGIDLRPYQAIVRRALLTPRHA